jgi:hypothetical protein
MAWTTWLRKGQAAKSDGSPTVAPVKFRPVFGTTFFWFEGHLFMIRKGRTRSMDERSVGSQALADLRKCHFPLSCFLSLYFLF